MSSRGSVCLVEREPVLGRHERLPATPELLTFARFSGDHPLPISAPGPQQVTGVFASRPEEECRAEKLRPRTARTVEASMS